MAGETTFMKIKVDGTEIKWEGEHHSDFEPLLKGYEHSFPIQGTTFTVNREVTAGTRLAGTAMAEPITLELMWDKNSPTFLNACHKGLKTDIDIVCLTADPDTSSYEMTMKIELKGGRITGWEATPGTAGESATLSLTYSFVEIKVEDPKGGTQTEFKMASMA